MMMVKEQITDRRFGRTHLAIYGPKWAQKKKVRKATLNGWRSLSLQAGRE